MDAAEAVFGQKGYEQASIAEITQKAGVALGTFYVYFPDKKTLFVETVDNLGRRLRTELSEAIEGRPDRFEVEEAGIRAFLAFVRRHKLLYRVVRQAEFVDPDCFRRYYENLAIPYARGLEEAMRAGQVRKIDPEGLAWILMGLSDYLGMRYVLWGGRRSADDTVALAVDFIRRGIEPSHRSKS
ncbi:MAG: TetR/AcrR family transcriptional regulator [Myxococcaceae bacterium]